MGDFSRDTHDARKHYSGVLIQQGRVQLDADWNEQLAIQSYRTELEARDVIGRCGVPKRDDGFRIDLTPDQQDLSLSPGRIYVDGLLCELDATPVPVTFVASTTNEVNVESVWVDGTPLSQGQWVEISAVSETIPKLVRIVGLDREHRRLTFDSSVADYHDAGAASIRRIATLLTQPHFSGATVGDVLVAGSATQPGSPPGAPPTSPPDSPPQPLLADGRYLLFLRGWKHEITALDDPRIREVALGGPDTATRLQNVWQARLLPVTVSSGEGRCPDRFTEWDDMVKPPTGRMNARTKPPEDEKDPCLLPPSAGFTRLENQLYRVEVHRGGERQSASIKWSRDNSVVRTSILKHSGATLTVADLGADALLGFAGGQWVEIRDEESVLNGIARPLVQINGVDPTTREVTLKSVPSGLAGKKNLQLVRWDQLTDAGPDGTPMAADWQELEGGVQVQFSDGTYRTGDYWLIPARTATGDIEWPPFALPNTQPVAQPPAGVRQHFCRLAFVEVAGGNITLQDCRRLFPALTEICAEDICVDNTVCDLPDVENLQDMIDRLCAARDLRWHNKHLHGSGIVCGLQVVCGPDPEGPRRHVTVRPGYALDCEGRDIVLRSADRLDLVTMVGALESPPESPVTGGVSVQDGEACLVLELDENGRRHYRLEPYTPPQNQMQSLLAGTLLLDFVDDCVKPLVDLIREELAPEAEEEELVGPARKRGIALGNLFIQYAEPVNGSRVFLSGHREEADRDSEHAILLQSYRRIRGLLQSRTFCAMFEGARPFPQYPFTDKELVTIFGRGSQTRLRLHPNGSVAYTLGASNLINVYDLDQNRLVALLEFPGGANVIVRDVALSGDGRQLFAVASLGDKDTLFATADIGSGFKYSWREPAVICDVLLLTLGTSAAAPERVFAVGKGKGLYEIDPHNVPQTVQPRHPFNAVGHLVITDRPAIAWMTAAAPGAAQSEVYDRVLRLNLTEAPDPLEFVTQVNGQSVTGRDDIAVVVPSGSDDVQSLKLYMVIDPPPNTTTKQVLVFDGFTAALRIMTDLGEATRIRLAHNRTTNHMMVTYEDSYRVGLLEPAADRPVTFSHPVQIAPLSIAAAPEGRHVYVLNFVSNTISKVPAKRFVPENALDLNALVEYRAAVIEAFTDLWGGLFQYLKDCFCDHLLVNCPVCDENDKLYLACVRFRDGQVFSVCNFSGRKYVKTFPTLEYWLSLFPVIPLIGNLVERICCAILPTLFGRYQAQRTTVSEEGVHVVKSKVTGQQFESGVMFARRTNLRAAFTDQLTKVRAGGGIAGDAVMSVIGASRAAPRDADAGAVARAEVTGMTIEGARARLAAAGVMVDSIETYEPSRAARNLARLALSPRVLRAGDRVTLVEENGRVRIADESTVQVAALREDVAAARADTVTLRRELAERDRAIAELRESTQAFREHIDTLRVLREEVTSLRTGVRMAEAPAKPARKTRARSRKKPSGGQEPGGQG